MCAPLALAAIPAIMGGASAVMGFMGQNAQAAANRNAANQAYGTNMNEEATRAGQIDTAQSENTVQATIDRITQAGRISASASSYGADAATAGHEVNVGAFTAGRSLSMENINSQNQRVAVGFGRDQAFYQRTSQINSVLPASPLSLVLGLGKAVASGVSAYSGFGGTFGGSTGSNSGALGASLPSVLPGDYFPTMPSVAG